LKTELGQDTREVWGLRPLSKQCGSGFAEIRSRNKRSCPESWTYQPDWCQASSGMIYTWEHIGGWRDTSLLMFWRRSDIQEHSGSSSGTLRMGTKTSSSQMRKSSPLRSSTTTRMIRFMLEHPVRQRRRFQRCREATTLPMSWFGGGCPIRRWHLFIFARKVWKLVLWPSVSRGCAIRSCETS